MTAPRVTSCPHCSTSFRVTQAQVEAANGSVRCGSCLQVFHAEDNFDKNEAQEAGPAVKKEFSTSTRPEELQPDTQVTPAPAKSVAHHGPFSTYDSEPEFTVSEESASKHESLDEIDSVLDQLDQNEINFSESEFKKNKWKKKLFLAATATFFSALLLLQFAWFQRSTLSLNPKFRPSYNILCQILTCKLPPLVNIEAIKSVQLLVRSHPDNSGALLVDTVMINNAYHPQPYPVLHLSFTDINGNLVANRAFTSSEYIGGELAGSKEMPAGQPIRLGLEIIDPGQEAVNYNLRFSQDKRP